MLRFILFDFEISLKLLNKNILCKLKNNYKVVIFCEGNPLKSTKDLVDNLIKKEKINITYQEIILRKYVKR